MPGAHGAVHQAKFGNKIRYQQAKDLRYDNEIGADRTRIGTELDVCTSEQIWVVASSNILSVSDE